MPWYFAARRTGAGLGHRPAIHIGMPSARYAGRLEGHLLGLEELTGDVHLPTRYQSLEDGEPLIECTSALDGVGQFAKGGEVAAGVVVAYTKAHDETAPRESVDRDGLTRHHLRSTTDQRRHHGSERDPRGPRGHDREARVRIEDVAHRRSIAKVVPDEESVPTRLLGQHREVRHPFDVGEPVERRKKESVLHSTARRFEERSRCAHPGQQQGRRCPSSSSSLVRRTRRSLVIACFAFSTQQMNSLRAMGVMSVHASSADGLAINVARRSCGSLCTTPPGTRWLLMGRQ